MKLIATSTVWFCGIALWVVCGLTACESGRARSLEAVRSNQPTEIVVVKPKNLTGRPLNAIDSRFYASDSLEISKQLSGVNQHVDFVAIFRVALESAVAELRESGDVPVGIGCVELHAALEGWDSSTLAQDGMLVVSVAGALTQPSQGGLVAQTYRSHSFRLLDVDGQEQVVGASRIIKGRYETLAYALADSLVRKLFEHVAG